MFETYTNRNLNEGSAFIRQDMQENRGKKVKTPFVKHLKSSAKTYHFKKYNNNKITALDFDNFAIILISIKFPFYDYRLSF